MGWANLPDDKVCGICGGPLSPDDGAGAAQESCALSHPGRALCLMCGRIIRGGFDAASYIDLPDEPSAGPLHR
jgi:hypothetical protein